MTIIAYRLIKPWIEKRDRAKLRTYSCQLEEGQCSLRTQGKCIQLLNLDYCVYGSQDTDLGPTRAARSYGRFVTDGEALQNSLPKLAPAEKKIAYVGDYVWLPYTFINNIDGAPQFKFANYLTLFDSGKPFMLKADFVPSMVVKLSKFRPQAIMGGEIEQYQRESLPLLLQDLRQFDPVLYEAALALDPSLATKTAVPGITFPVSFLKARDHSCHVRFQNSEFFFYAKDGSLEGNWPGLDLGINVGDVKVRFIPKPDTEVSLIDRNDALRLKAYQDQHVQ